MTMNTLEGIVELTRLSLTKQNQLVSEQYIDSGRAIYASRDDLYLFHTQDSLTGVGMWVVSRSIPNNDIESALYKVESWAVEPALSRSTKHFESSSWVVPNTDSGGVSSPHDLQLTCLDLSDTVFFESSATLQQQLTGFYTARNLDDDDHSAVVYTLIKHNVQDQPTYLFHLPPVVECVETATAIAESSEQMCQQTTTWLIGDRYGVDAGLSYSTVTREVPPGEQQHVQLLPSRGAEWRFVLSGQPWTLDPTAAPSYGVPGVVFDKSSKGAQAFVSFAAELVERVKHPV